jgi:hypothetical protein
MASVCAVSFGVCLFRVTRVDDNGNVIAGDNSYVTDSVQTVTLAPNLETGNDFAVRNGCGCGIASRKFPDTFKYWDLTVQLAKREPILESFLLGSNAITNGADTVGLAFPSALACDEANPLVAVEWWSEAGVGSGLDAQYPYYHWVIPASFWQLGDTTFEEGPGPASFTGSSQTNGNWGEGPYGDGPPDGEDISEGGYWATDDSLPTAECEAQAVTAVS